MVEYYSSAITANFFLSNCPIFFLSNCKLGQVLDWWNTFYRLDALSLAHSAASKYPVKILPQNFSFRDLSGTQPNLESPRNRPVKRKPEVVAQTSTMV